MSVRKQAHKHTHNSASQQNKGQSEEWYLSGEEETGERSDNERLRGGGGGGGGGGETIERLEIHEGRVIEMREGGREPLRRR